MAGEGRAEGIDRSVSGLLAWVPPVVAVLEPNFKQIHVDMNQQDPQHRPRSIGSPGQALTAYHTQGPTCSGFPSTITERTLVTQK